MIYGIGTDILRQERIQKIWDRHGEKLADKILGEAERAEFASSTRPVRYLTMAFAAKEAFVKAHGTGFSGIGFKEAGVVRESSGKPVFIFSPGLQARLTTLGITKAHLSLSDEGGLVCAMVVLETAS